MPAEPVLEIEQGVRLNQIIECFDDPDKTVRTPMADFKLILQARPRPGVDELLLDLSTDDGSGRLTIETATDGPAGEWLRVKLNAAETSEVPAEGGVWGVARIPPAAPLDVDALVEGILKVKKKIISVQQPAP